MLTGLLREIPKGDADDAPAIPHTYPAEPVPGLDQRILDFFNSLPGPVQVTATVGAFVLFAALLVALALVLRAAAKRLVATRGTTDKASDADRAAAARDRAVRLTYVIGGFASVVSAAYTLYVFRDVPGANPIIWAAFVSIAVLFELVVIMLAANALANALETGRVGVEGLLLGLASLAIAYVTWTKQDHPALKPLAVLPLAAALSYFVTLRQAVRAYWARRRSGEIADEQPPSPLKVMWRNVLVALHLTAPSELSLSDQDRKRRVTRYVRSSYKSEKARFAWQRWWAGLWLDMRLIALQERYGPEVYAQAIQQIAALSQAKDKMRQAAKAGVTVWDVAQELAAGTGIGSGTAAGTAGGTGTGSATGTARSTDAGTSGGTGTGTPSGTAPVAPKGTATLADLRHIAEGMSSADLLARKSDFEVAHLYAVEEGRKVYEVANSLTDAVRTYALVMFAVGHRDLGVWNMQRMQRELRNDPTAKNSTLPGRVARQVRDELAEDPAAADGVDDIDELIQAAAEQRGGTDA